MECMNARVLSLPFQQTTSHGGHQHSVEAKGSLKRDGSPTIAELENHQNDHPKNDEKYCLQPIKELICS